MATTPPPPSPSSLRVPGAPLHGAGYDTFEPYPTRYSARLANRRAMKSSDTPLSRYADSQGQAFASSSPTKQKRKTEQVLSPPGTNLSRTPARERYVNRIHDDHGCLSGSLSSEASGFNDASLSSQFSSLPSSRRSESQALPTPAKTPSKKKITGDISSTARTLFPPAVKKLRKMDSSRPQFQTPLDLDDETSSSSGSKGSIDIFTDSRDRVPVAPRKDNPLARGSEPEDPFTTKLGRDGRPLRRPKVQVGEDDEMTYMFRGKRVTRRFMQDDMEEDDPNDLGLFAGREHLLPDPSVLQAPTVRRKEYKPRLLWTPGGTPVPSSPRETTPSSTKDEPEPAHKSDNEDEATDEEDATSESEFSRLVPFASSVEPSTSISTSALPSGDPAYIRKLRSQGRVEPDPTETPTRNVKLSPSKSKQTPFHAWLRKKKGPEDSSSSTTSSPKSTPAKRDAHDEPVGSPAKRTRGNTTHANTV